MNSALPPLPISLCLYGTSECHLCDQALTQVQPFINAQICQVEHIDIVSDLDLYERYALCIPVLYNPRSQSELRWPFTALDVQQWLQNDFSQQQELT